MWYSGNPVRIDHFWLDGNKKAILKGIMASQKESIGNLDAKVDTVLKQSKKGLRPFHFIIGLLVITSLLLANYFDKYRFKEPTALINTIFLREDITIGTEEVNKKLSQNNMLSDINIKILRKGNHIWCSGEVYTWRQKELIGKEISSITGIESVDTKDCCNTSVYHVSR